MRQRVTAAELEKYNANRSGKAVGDCVKRSLSLAFGLPYSEISKLLVARMKEMKKPWWNRRSVYGTVITDLGGTPLEKIPTLITVGEFADESDPDIAYIVVCGKEYGTTSHAVCIRDKKIWDSWDCSEYIVTYVSEVKSESTKQVTDIKNAIPGIVKSGIVYNTLYGEAERYAGKKAWELQLDYECRILNSYTIKTSWVATFFPDELIPKRRKYNFDIVLTIEPYMNEEQAVEFIKKTGKQRMYDRMWAIGEQEKKLFEQVETEAKLAASGSNLGVRQKYAMTNQEMKFLKTLPGWAQALALWVDIDRPEAYSDSYTVKMYKLPEDNVHPDENEVYFRAYNADQIRRMIKRYKEKLELPEIDYSREEELY